MPTTVKTGWLKDKNGDKFAPKTLTSQVQTSDGVLLEDKIQADLATAKEDILANVTIDIDSNLSATSTNPVQNKVINAEFDAMSDAISEANTIANAAFKDVSFENDTLDFLTNDGSGISIPLPYIKKYTDNKVAQEEAGDDAEYPLLSSNMTASNATTRTTTANFSSGVTLNPFNNSITATTFNGNATTATSATSATKANQDASGNVITSTYETKADATTKLNEAKTYTDTALSQKSQVQFITWEADD